MRRIDHGAYIVKIFRHFIIILSHQRSIQLAVDDNSIHIRRDGNSLTVQTFGSIFHKFRDDSFPALFFRLRTEIHILHSAVRSETDIVKLNLVKTDCNRLFSDFKQILPDLFLVGIYPGQSRTVPEQIARLVMKREIRPVLRQKRILKRHNTGDQINIMLLTLLNQPRHVGNQLFGGTDPGNHRGIHLIDHPAVIILHVDDHGIQFRPVHQSDQIIHPGGSRHGSGDIDPLYLYAFFLGKQTVFSGFLLCIFSASAIFRYRGLLQRAVLRNRIT